MPYHQFGDPKNAPHRVSVKLVCKAENKILLIKRRTTADYNLVGGGVDKGENLMQAIEREFREETGKRLDIPVQLLHVEIRSFPPGGQFDAAINVFYLLSYEKCFSIKLEEGVYDSFKRVSKEELLLLPTSEHTNKDFLLTLFSCQDS